MKNKCEGNREPLGERNIVCTLTKESQNYISMCDMGLPCSKLNNSNPIKDRNMQFPFFNTKLISKHIKKNIKLY